MQQRSLVSEPEPLPGPSPEQRRGLMLPQNGADFAAGQQVGQSPHLV
jgi:hypothetical protein